jgi:hypothetical protein
MGYYYIAKFFVSRSELRYECAPERFWTFSPKSALWITSFIKPRVFVVTLNDVIQRNAY